ncbi:hypothetical protein BIT28_19055 [Photobacterium proteolyticum]|uniref:Polysaccharide biosynthesis protein n=1 Tax=Photobacterium proteolyticum TaxID=1903952 RepID=A0A1Q9GN79_9GAMM|nr:PssD/Cps14F family polysaccharide biosynthesis glycosyltransferase [Photobacterium proteolyticum]OLQ76114.1 hypothetical protein BIT28_19055 [Photobacterium proteolyticum]
MKVVAICSGGGHMAELKRALPHVNGLNITWITASSGYNAVKKMPNTLYICDPHTSKLMFLVNFVQSLYFFIKTRPQIVISSGAGLCIFYCLICKVFKRKLLFLETGARISTPSKTGMLLYKYADLFIIQSKCLLKYYPKARVGLLK